MVRLLHRLLQKPKIVTLRDGLRQFLPLQLYLQRGHGLLRISIEVRAHRLVEQRLVKHKRQLQVHQKLIHVWATWHGDGPPWGGHRRG